MLVTVSFGGGDATRSGLPGCIWSGMHDTCGFRDPQCSASGSTPAKCIELLRFIISIEGTARTMHSYAPSPMVRMQFLLLALIHQLQGIRI